MTRRNIILLVLLVVSAEPPVALAQTDYQLDPQTGDVTWGGDRTDPNPIGDFVPPAGTQQGRLQFYWTREGQKHEGYVTFDEFNATNRRLNRHFFQPKDRTITDWKQTITNGDGTSDVFAGNIQPQNSWSFQPLEDLPLYSEIPWRIPDLAPSQGGLTIYTAVNLGLYLQNNPFGFLDGQWGVGQTLDDLGVDILDGQIAGLQGIFWATSEFVFDPNSINGFVPSGGVETLLDSDAFQQQNGPIVILAEHMGTIPEPSSLVLSGAGALGLLGYAWRCRKGPLPNVGVASSGTKS